MADQRDMGLGTIGTKRDLVFKRKFRWTLRFEQICDGGTIDENFVKLAARPSLTIEETEINFLHGKTWIPGKAAWETITVTYYDVATTNLSGLWSWLWSVYDFGSSKDAAIQLNMGSSLADYSGVGVLTLYDGCGKALEEWQLKHAWPQAINFGELDYANSEEATVELTLRYSQVSYESLCPPLITNVCCDGCRE